MEVEVEEEEAEEEEEEEEQEWVGRYRVGRSCARGRRGRWPPPAAASDAAAPWSNLE